MGATIFGLTSVLFIKLTSKFGSLLSKYIKNPMIKSMAGGIIVILLVFIIGTSDYIGLSLPLMADSFDKIVSPFAEQLTRQLHPLLWVLNYLVHKV